MADAVRVRFARGQLGHGARVGDDLVAEPRKLAGEHPVQILHAAAADGREDELLPEHEIDLHPSGNGAIKASF